MKTRPQDQQIQPQKQDIIPKNLRPKSIQKAESDLIIQQKYPKSVISKDKLNEQIQYLRKSDMKNSQRHAILSYSKVQSSQAYSEDFESETSLRTSGKYQSVSLLKKVGGSNKQKSQANMLNFQKLKKDMKNKNDQKLESTTPEKIVSGFEPAPQAHKKEESSINTISGLSESSKDYYNRGSRRLGAAQSATYSSIIQDSQLQSGQSQDKLVDCKVCRKTVKSSEAVQHIQECEGMKIKEQSKDQSYNENFQDEDQEDY